MRRLFAVAAAALLLGAAPAAPQSNPVVELWRLDCGDFTTAGS